MRIPVVAQRFYVSGLGEYYLDALTVEAWIKDRTMAAEAGSLLSSKLAEREDKRNKMVSYLAKKRGITPDQLWLDILKGRAKPITSEEIQELEAIEPGNEE